MIFNEIKCHVNTSLGLVGGMHPPCVRACAQHTQRDKVFAWAITEFQSSRQTANAIWQWAKVGRYHVSVKIRWHRRRSTVLIDKLPSSNEEEFLGFEQ